MVGIHAISVANLMSEATALHMGRPVINVRVLIISKPFVIPRLQQPRQCPALTEARSHGCCKDMHSTGSNNGNGKGGQKKKKKMPKKPPKQRAYEVTFKNLVLSEVATTSGGRERERMVKYHIKRQSFQNQMKKVCITGFLALQYIEKWLKAPTLRVSLQKGCTWTLTQTIGLRSLQM